MCEEEPRKMTARRRREEVFMANGTNGVDFWNRAAQQKSYGTELICLRLGEMHRVGIAPQIV